MEAFVQSVLEWVAANPNWALALVFISSLSESLFLIGLLVPGALLMFAAGAIVSTGALQLGPTMMAAIAAAILGDGLSYWLGRSMRDRLHYVWPISRYPKLMEQGERFFHKHGGKGVILGRFVGAVRPIVPTVAGASGMRPAHFFIVDTISALGWAPVYILPGVVFGASLGLAAEVAGRLVVVLFAVVAVVWAVIWSTQHLILWFSRHAEEFTVALLDWSHRHRRLGRLGSSLADPDQPETPGLAILALLLLTIAWVILTLLWGRDQTPPLLDSFIFQQLQALRTHNADVVAVGLSQLGGWKVYLPLAAAVLAGLLSMKRTRATAHWIAAVGFAAVVAVGINLLINAPAPYSYHAGQISGEYHGGNIVLGTVIYAFIPVLITTRITTKRRWWHYGFFYTLIALIALAQLYLGAQWFSDTLLGISLGLIWVALLTLGYRRRRPQRIPATPLAIIVISALSAAAAIQWTLSLPDDLRLYQEDLHSQIMSEQHWRSEGYRDLSDRVIDLAGTRNRPINLQWAGRIDAIRSELIARGWEAPAPISIGGAMLWLTDAPPIGTLPMLPQVHDGRAQALIMRKPIDDASQWVLRLWPSRWLVSNAAGEVPLWLGSTHRVTLNQSLPYLTFPANAVGYVDALMELGTPTEPVRHRESGAAGSPAAADGGNPGGDWILLRSTH